MFHIRDFRKSDFGRLWEIDQTCFSEDIAYSEPELAWYITRGNAFTIVAVDPEKQRKEAIVGFLTAHSSRTRGVLVGHIITIDVLPQGRRSGMGSELMKVAERRLAEQGCTRITLEVAVDNVAAIKFYKRHRYSVARTIPRYYNGELDALEMDKELQAAEAAP